MNVSWRGPLQEGITQRLLLLRHAEPSAHSRGRCYGKLDLPLSNTGRTQATQIGQLLATLSHTPITTVFSSPKARAKETAALVLEQFAPREHPLELHFDQRFSEIDFGDFEGLLYSEAQALHPEVFTQWMETPTEVCFPNGESHRDMRVRIHDACRALDALPSGQVILLVTHAGVIRTILSQALGLAYKHMFRIDQDYAGLSCIDRYAQGESVLRTLNWGCA